jgi:hypothetical protein
MKFKSLIIGFILTFFLYSSTQAVWLSKDDFMQQYSTKFVNGFPRDTNRRVVMKQWCNAITDPSITNDKKNIIEWFVYASGTYTSPNQSVLAYLICAPFLDGAVVKNRFNKNLIAAIKITQRDKITPNIDIKTCPITIQANNLNDCDLIKSVSNITPIILNDITNIRQGTSRWYMSPNEEDVWYFVAQHFALASWNTVVDRINSINTALCDNDNAPYFGEWASKVPRCWFPTTYNTIKSYRTQFGKEIIKKTIAIDWEKLLQYQCDDPDNIINLIWCGINDHSSTQAYSSMMYNELWFYEQFLAMYESTTSLSSTFLIGNKTGLWREWQDQLLNQIKLIHQNQLRYTYHATQASINLISQLESAYPLHVWLLAADEASASAIDKYIKPFQASIKFWMIDRLNTQKKDDTAKGE